MALEICIDSLVQSVQPQYFPLIWPPLIAINNSKCIDLSFRETHCCFCWTPEMFQYAILQVKNIFLQKQIILKHIFIVFFFFLMGNQFKGLVKSLAVCGMASQCLQIFKNAWWKPQASVIYSRCALNLLVVFLQWDAGTLTCALTCTRPSPL